MDSQHIISQLSYISRLSHIREKIYLPSALCHLQLENKRYGSQNLSSKLNIQNMPMQIRFSRSNKASLHANLDDRCFGIE